MYTKLSSAIAEYSDKPFPLCFLDYEFLDCRDSTESKHDAHCICGEKIRWEYVIKNKENGQHFVVGSVCIESVMQIIDKETPAEVVAAINNLIKRMKKAKASKKHKFCERCQKTRILNYKYKDYLQTIFCRNCYDPDLRKFICKANIAPDCWQYTYNNQKMKFGGYPDKCGRCWKLLQAKKSGL
jgi:hypothetical protein